MNRSPTPEVFFWNQPAAESLQQLTSSKDGLTTEEAERRQEQYGPNIAGDVARRPLWLQFLARFRNPLIVLLLFASMLSALTGDVTSFIIIVAMVLLSVVLDFVQQVRAENSADALRKSVAVTASVMRDGTLIELPVQELVPGDVTRLVPGDLVPADGILLESKDLYINQALLTGESFPAEKLAQDLATPTSNITEASNAVFMGASVISGTAQMLIVATGKQTRLGQFAGTLSLQRPPTTFEQGNEKFGMLILRIAFVMVLFVMLVNVAFHRPLLESFLFALALAVGLTPELLPMIMTITLARGAVRMAKEKVIVKRLPAMHNLGAMNILCTDKTGTLTEAHIRLIRTLDIQGDESERVYLLAYLNSFFETGIKTQLDLAVLERKQLDIPGWKKIDEVPFDFERRRISLLLEKDNQRYLVVKGAPEDILKLSDFYEMPDGQVISFDDAKKQECYDTFEKLGEEGLRVLGVAIRSVPIELNSAVVTDETELTFVGFIAFLDPPKESAAGALKLLAEAGIKVKIITGDNERVTQYVCKMLGMPEIKTITGDQIFELTEEAFMAQVDSIDAFCRITPQQKSKIIQVLRSKGNTVGFLGDGINDAAALHMADVGISVNTAADVAKEAAEIILLEEDLEVIHRGVLEGRRAVVNTQKYILMAASSNFGNMFSMAGATLILPFLPMLPIQILLNNLLYDTSQTAIPLDNVGKDTLNQPLHWDIKKIYRFMLVMGPISSVFDYLTFYVLWRICNSDQAMFHSGWFTESLLTQVLIIFAIRTRRPMFHSRPNAIVALFAITIAVVAVVLPFTSIGAWFGLVPFPAIFFWYLIGVLIVYFGMVEFVKKRWGNYVFP
jgi:Mg2+-importing ATPase